MPFTILINHSVRIVGPTEIRRKMVNRTVWFIIFHPRNIICLYIIIDRISLPYSCKHDLGFFTFMLFHVHRNIIIHFVCRYAHPLTVSQDVDSVNFNREV